MGFSIEKTIIITLIFIGYTHADSPRISEKVPSDGDYKVVNESFTGLVFKIRVQDNDKSDKLLAKGDDTFTNLYFNITSNPLNREENDIWVYVNVMHGLDRETLGDNVKVRLKITDEQGNPIRYTFTVYIQDINDNAPVFQNQPYNLEIPELPCNKTTIVYTDITATDADKNANGRVSYSMEPKAQSENTREEYKSTFRIDSKNGRITQTKCLDYKNNSYYQFTVTAKDGGPNGGLNTTADLIIRVTDVQNQPPFFTGAPYRKEINENNKQGSSVLTIDARDGDSGVSNEVNYTIENCSCGDNLFDIGVKSGIITTKTVLDRDDEPIKGQSGNCDLVVLVQEVDHGLKQWGNTTTATTTVTIIVKDIDDNRPTFEEIKYTANVKENTPKDSLLTLNRTIFVHDNDQGENARMTITLENTDNSTCTDFVASPSEIQGRGSVSILVNNSALLDYEVLKNETIQIQVVATEVNNISSRTNVSLEINVQDTNDNYPKFNTTKFTVSIPENTRNNTIITRITAQDADTYPEYKNITYSVSGGSGRFTVDPDTGYIRTLCKDCDKELDREVRSDFYLTLFATDKGGNRNSTEVIVILTDMNDNIPQFSRPVYTVFLEENSKNLDVVDVDASDRDQEKSNNSQFTFSIINSTPLMNNLTINETTGEIKLKTSLDYEKLTNPNGIVNITVEVKDEGSPSLNSTCEVMLTVQDKNDNNPIFNQTIYYGNVAEDRSSNTTFTTNISKVTATDKDVTAQNKRLSYFKTAGSDKFSVDSSTGIIRITMNSHLDREGVSEYNLTIIAIDQGSPPLTGTTTVTINVTDVNDEKPEFDNQEYTASVKENTTSNNDKIIQTCNASDRDLDSSLFYNITEVEARDENGKSVNGSLVKDYFDIHINNGSVFVSGTLDRETAATVRLRIQVTDQNAVHNEPQTDFANLTITLTDINDNFPTFEKTQYNISVSEGAEKGRKYDGPRAIDRDVNRTITYKLQPGPYPINSFTIDPKTGEILKDGELDRETNSSLLITVVATDNGVPPLNSSVFVYVRVLDVNDNPPEFSSESRGLKERHIDENTAVGEVIININATDKDEGPNNNNITYFLEQNDNYFTINETDGVISVNISPDREVISQIKLTIFAKDNPISTDAQKTSSMTITIYFDDVNDNSPAFAQDYKLTVEEDKPIGSVVIQVSAKDLDEQNTNNSKISYNIENTTLNKFSIDENTGYISINSSLVDFVGNYSMTVVAYDHGYPQRNGSTIVNVTVADKNGHAPVIRNVPDGHEIRIYECTRAGTVIHNFNYTDADFGINKEASFNISSSLYNLTGVFNLTKGGSLTVVGKLDANIKSSYTFDITATDKGIPALTSKAVTITVGIMDFNDHLPSFHKDKVRFTIQENSVYNDTIGSVTAYDEDKDSKSCYEIEDKAAKIFSVNKTTGYIYSLQELDYEKNKTIRFKITVNDCSITKNISGYCDKISNEELQKMKERTNDTIEVIIDVKDINDNPPVFEKKQFATGMRRNTEADVELELHLRNETYISDKDSPQNGILSWIFSNYGNITVSPELQDKIKENSGARPCDDGLNHIFCVTKNGTIVNNKFFSEDLSGYFILTVKVEDNGGNDTADITIYLISDSQVVTMTIRDDKGTVAGRKDKLLQELSSILGHTAVFDSLEDHKENGEINTHSSDLSFHIVDKETKAVLSGDDAIELFDKHANSGQMIALQNEYNVITVAKQTMTDNADETGSEKLTFILVAISVAEALIIATIIFIAFSARTKFRRKLKAAVITTPDMEMHALDQKESAIPGSNMYSKQNNPLFNTEVIKNVQEGNIDTNSISSADDVDLDVNDVDDPNTVYDKMEEREITLDMYTDDTVNNVSSEDLLGAALLHHAMRKSKESLDRLDDTDEPHQSTDNPAAFINDAYTEELESTEI